MSEEFPISRLASPAKSVTVQKSVVLVACGSYSPVTYAHLRMFEQARDVLRQKYKLKVLGGFFSCVNDAYRKKGLVSGAHRARMLELALASSDWIELDTWEMRQKGYQRTRVVLSHFVQELRKFYGPRFEDVKISLLCGADLFESFTRPGVWRMEDVEYILGNHGVVVLERGDLNLDAMIFNHDVLHRFSNNILTVPAAVKTDLSSSMIRKLLKRGYSTKYLIPDTVRDYIDENRLFREDVEGPALPDVSIFSKPIDWDEFFQMYPPSRPVSPTVETETEGEQDSDQVLIEALRKSFEAVDRDSDGMLAIEEVAAIFQKDRDQDEPTSPVTPHPVPDFAALQDVRNLHKRLRYSADGKITWEEFKRAAQSYIALEKVRKAQIESFSAELEAVNSTQFGIVPSFVVLLRQSFDDTDTNGDGLLSRQEVITAIEKHSVVGGDSDIVESAKGFLERFREMDVGGDGVVSFEELVRYIISVLKQ